MFEVKDNLLSAEPTMGLEAPGRLMTVSRRRLGHRRRQRREGCALG